MNPPLHELALRFARRAAASNFQRERAADDERALLAAASPPIADPLAQDYVAWRRAALWLAGVLLAIASLIAVAEHRPVAEQAARAQVEAAGQHVGDAEMQQLVAQVTEGIGKGNIEIIDGLQDFLLFVKMAVATLVLLAAWRWQRVRRSRSFARWGFLTALVLPLLVSAWPWSMWLDFSHLDQQGGFGQAVQNSAMVKQQVSLAIASVLMLTIAPKLIALFPGIVRSSLALKTLLPEAAAPGWLAVVFAPFLAGFLLLVLCFLGQAQGSWLLLAGIAALCCAPIVYVRRAADLVRPHSADEVGAVVGGVRRTALVTNVIGVALLAGYLLSFDAITWSAALHLMFDAAGGIMLSMVVISDITLALLAFSQRQGAQFQSSGLREQYEQRLQALGSAGLTDVEGALGVKDLDDLRKLRQG